MTTYKEANAVYDAEVERVKKITWGNITKPEMVRLTAFCSTKSPGFLTTLKTKKDMIRQFKTIYAGQGRPIDAGPDNRFLRSTLIHLAQQPLMKFIEN